MEFSRQEYWSGLPFLSLGDPPSPGIECESPALWLNSVPSEPPGKPRLPFSLVQFSLSVMSNSETPWTVAQRASLSMGFSRQEYWSGLPCPSPEDLPGPGIKSTFSALQADALPMSHRGSPCLFLPLTWNVCFTRARV